jgi:hypothetical protein
MDANNNNNNSHYHNLNIVERLKRAWRNEKAAPEILEYESELVDTILRILKDKVCTLDPLLLL